MKKKVLKGWVTVTRKEGRLTTYAEVDFYMFRCKRDAEYAIPDTKKVIKVRVTVEPA